MMFVYARSKGSVADVQPLLVYAIYMYIYLLSRIHFNTSMSYDEKENEYDQEMTQSQTTDHHTTPWGRDTEH